MFILALKSIHATLATIVFQVCSTNNIVFNIYSFDVFIYLLFLLLLLLSCD
jgi:hypothetical protein